MGSPVSPPEERMHSNPMYSQDRPAVWRSESARYVHQYRQQGKHVQSFIRSQQLTRSRWLHQLPRL